MRARRLLRLLLGRPAAPSERRPDARPSEVDRTPPPPERPPPSPEVIREMEWEEAEAAPHITEAVRADAEAAVNAEIWPGMPSVWRCYCGGRPFVGSDCPRCGRSQEEGEKFHVD